jgi:hypothetical protein
MAQLSLNRRPGVFQKNHATVRADNDAISRFQNCLDYRILSPLLQELLIAFRVENDDVRFHNSFNSPQDP